MDFYDIEVGEGEGEDFKWWFKVIGDKPVEEQRYGSVESGSMWMERVLLRFSPEAKSLVVQHYSGPAAAPEPLKSRETILEELRDPTRGYTSGSGPYRLFATPALANDPELLEKYVEQAEVAMARGTTAPPEAEEAAPAEAPEEQGEEYEVEWLDLEGEEEG